MQASSAPEGSHASIEHICQGFDERGCLALVRLAELRPYIAEDRNQQKFMTRGGVAASRVRVLGSQLLPYNEHL